MTFQSNSTDRFGV